MLPLKNIKSTTEAACNSEPYSCSQTERTGIFNSGTEIPADLVAGGPFLC